MIGGISFYSDEGGIQFFGTFDNGPNMRAYGRTLDRYQIHAFRFRPGGRPCSHKRAPGFRKNFTEPLWSCMTGARRMTAVFMSPPHEDQEPSSFDSATCPGPFLRRRCPRCYCQLFPGAFSLYPLALWTIRRRCAVLSYQTLVKLANFAASGSSLADLVTGFRLPLAAMDKKLPDS
jgi:hypothetical protein